MYIPYLLSQKLVHKLKYIRLVKCIGVAPLVGAWIETLLSPVQGKNCEVVPLVGAWIET